VLPSHEQKHLPSLDVVLLNPPPSYWNNANIEAYLAGVPNDKMIILDLNTEASPVFSRTSNYFGKVRFAQRQK
jgi:hypothetical protein